MINLYKHQADIIRDNSPKLLIPLGTGSGKTRIALLLAQGPTLVIAPKTQRDDGNWPREKEKLNLSLALQVVSKEDFRRDYLSLPKCKTLIIDEAHTVLGVTPNLRFRKGKAIPKCSQLFEAVQKYIALFEPERVYLVSATAAKNPMAIWAAASLLGRRWNWYSYRATFYVKLPMAGREVWQVKKDKKSKEHLARLVLLLSQGHIGRLDDYFEVPTQTIEYRHCPLTLAQQEAIDALPLSFPDPLVLIGKTHQVEQGFLIDETVRRFDETKLQELMLLATQNPKILIFARYRAQIEQIANYFKGVPVPVLIMTGDTKDRGELIAKAEASERCIFIAQSQISTGYELPSFRCTVFASASYSTVDNTQAMGRTLRANALAENKYIYLYSGEIDEAVIACLKNHEDFNEILYAKRLS